MNGKEIYLNTEPTTPFNQILGGLRQKYDWLNDMNVKGFVYNNSMINMGLNPLQVGLQKGAKIEIIT